MVLISGEGSIVLKFDAKNVNIVVGSENVSEAKLLLDGKYVNNKNKGSDVNDKGIVVINDERLYNVVAAEDYGQLTLRIDVSGKGFKIYTFTFG